MLSCCSLLMYLTPGISNSVMSFIQGAELSMSKQYQSFNRNIKELEASKNVRRILENRERDQDNKVDRVTKLHFKKYIDISEQKIENVADITKEIKKKTGKRNTIKLCINGKHRKNKDNLKLKSNEEKNRPTLIVHCVVESILEAQKELAKGNTK